MVGVVRNIDKINIMTREEEIKESASAYALSMCDDCLVMAYCNESFKKCVERRGREKVFADGAKWADTHPKSPWISTENELPTKGGHYLCMDEDHHISNLAFRGNRWVNSSAFFDVSLEVVKYWMPIPNLPQE